MKKSIVKLFGIFILASSLITGCSSSDNPTPTPPPAAFVLDANNFKGTITECEIVLNATTVYKLPGTLQVNNGATLTIPSGTLIKSHVGAAAILSVGQG